MSTHHKVIFGSCATMPEIADNSVHLAITSPPYFNAPFDYEGVYNDYDEYLQLLRNVASESYRVLQPGRIFVLNIDDMLVKGEKYPITADATRIFLDAGFRYRDRIIWRKPEGYIRISRRSGVQLQHPYPMYFYPDNLLESILIFQKGKFLYKSIPQEIKEESRVDIEEFQQNKWFLTLWEMTNVLPNAELEKNIAAFPTELPYRFVKLFSYKGETVLDPFTGSGTTLAVARMLGRNSIGIEVNNRLEPIIRKKLLFDNGQMQLTHEDDTYEVLVRGEL
jgi:site-specific DNA-methyltransferase (adenine-specific)